MRGSLARFVGEPLLHFLLLGAALFAVYALFNRNSGTDERDIVITTGQIEHLAGTFENFNQRAPTETELKALIEDYVREEIYNRQAVGLGLDRNDAVIRYRLRQKMEFFAEEAAARAEPSDEQLRVYLTAHPDDFGVEQQYTFTHVYFNLEQRRDGLAHDMEETLKALKSGSVGANADELGDGFLLNQDFQSLPASEVAKLFGDSFAAQLAKLPIGEWRGPIESGYGMHLVWVHARSAARTPSLDEVRERVRREWANVERKQANEAFYQGLRQRYNIVIERRDMGNAARVPAAEATQ